MSESSKKRAPNFTTKEKTLLLNIIYTYKDVIENKKTDALTWKEKEHVWGKVTNIFNSQNPAEYSRTQDSLRKLYDNLKKNARKEAAEVKQDMLKTGGGEPVVVNKDTTTDLVLEIINRKTVYGLPNSFDSDGIVLDMPVILDMPVVQTDLEEVSETNWTSPDASENTNLPSDHSYSGVPTQANTSDIPAVPCGSNDWGDYSARKLKKPCSSELRHTWTKRRRPGIQQMNSSQLSEQYAKLAELKIEYYHAEKENTLKRRHQEEEIFELNKKKILLDIQFKELQIKSFEHQNPSF